MRAALCCVIFLIGLSSVRAEDAVKESAADDAIAAAIAVLEAKLDETDDTLAKARIQRAIRELETVMEDGNEKPVVDPVSFEVKPAVLKKKFQGKAVYEPKSGLLSITYDFAKKDQLKDFEFADAKPIITSRTLLIDGSERITHVARFKSFSIKGQIGVKAMRNGGIHSTNGSSFGLGGLNKDGLYLTAAGGQSLDKIVPENVRTGAVSFQFVVSPAKTSVQYANDRLTAPTVKADDIHQLVFDGGTEGYAFSNIVISGIPDPKWFQEFLEAK